MLAPQMAPADKVMTLDLAALQAANAPSSAPPAAATSATPAQLPPNVDPDFAEPHNPAVELTATPTPTSAPAASQPASPPSDSPLAAGPSPAADQPPAAPPAGPPNGGPRPQGQNPWAALASIKDAGAQPSNAGVPSQQGASVPAPADPALAASTPAPPAPFDASEPSSTYLPPAPPTRTAVNPSIPPELKQSFPVAPAASTPAANTPAPPAGTAPAKQCYTNAEGVQICYMYDEQRHNTTDVHKQNGVNDFHNQAGAHEKEGVQGHIPGNNITSTLNKLGENAPTDEHKDGNTVFQGKTDTQVGHSQDIHKDNSTYTDHEMDTGNGDYDWKSAYKGPDGSKEMAQINKDGNFKGESDTSVNADGKNKIETEEWQGGDDHQFSSDKPGSKDDSSLTWDEDWAQAKQKAEFQGKDVYDLHEESSSDHSVQAKVSGDQGWKDFEDDMKDFDDTFFAEDADWKQKMQDPRYQAGATMSTAFSVGPAAMPTGIAARDAMVPVIANSGNADGKPRRVDDLGIAFAVVVASVIVIAVCCCLGRRLRVCLLRRRENRNRRQYVSEIEGFHTVDSRDDARVNGQGY